MPYLKQNNPRLNKDVQAIGCFFRSSLHMAELKAKKALTADQINAAWDECKAKGYVDEENCVIASAPIANIGARALNLKGRFIEVATFKNGVMTWYGVPKDQRRADFYIMKIKQGGPSGTHFINVNKYGKLTWDPHAPAIKRLGVYHTICYQYQEEK